MAKKRKTWILPVHIENENEDSVRAESKKTGATFAKIINLALKQRYGKRT